MMSLINYLISKTESLSKMEKYCKTQVSRRILSKGDDKYDKISHRQKILLIKRVLYDRCGIKQIADSLNLNYSTAKTLIRRFKTRGHRLNQEFIVGCSQWFDIYDISQQKQRCSYVGINEIQQVKLEEEKNPASPFSCENSQQAVSEATNQNAKNFTPIRIVQQVLFKE